MRHPNVGCPLVQEFFDAPENAVDAACADDFAPVFVASASEQVDEYETLDVNIGGIPASVVIPADWTHTGDGFVSDARRGGSILDSAELLQFVGAEAVVASVDTTLESQFDGSFSELPERQVGSDTWTVRTFTTGDLTVTSLRTLRDSNTIVLYLFSSPTEHEALVETVMVEAAAGLALN